MWILCGLVSLLVIFVTHFLYCSWEKLKNNNGRLPPGSNGLPFIGETLQFLAPYTSYDIPPFIKSKMARYGALFRINLVGRPMVISTDPEINYYIFQQEGKYFQCWYPESFSKIIGEDSLLDYHGVFHKYLKNLISNLVSPEKLRENLLPEMDTVTRTSLQSWTKPVIIDAKEGTEEMVFEYFAKKLISYDETKAGKKLRHSYKDFMDGLVSFPLNIPGTAYHASLKGRKNAIRVIKDILEERKSAQISSEEHRDFLDFLINEMKKEGTILNEVIVINMVFVLLFATYETTSTAVTLAIKFLTDHPSVLAELTKEHEEILRSRGNDESAVTWEEYKSMTFTQMFINETVRLANIAPWIFRKVIKDIQLNGYTIPAGWIVMISTSALHLNPDKYEDPLKFNPWRWEGKDLHAGSKNFMAFGGGVRLCVGAHFAKLQTAIFLHYLVTKYRWEIVKGGNISRSPGLMFPNGLHINISERQN